MGYVLFLNLGAGFHWCVQFENFIKLYAYMYTSLMYITLH